MKMVHQELVKVECRGFVSRDRWCLFEQSLASVVESVGTRVAMKNRRESMGCGGGDPIVDNKMIHGYRDRDEESVQATD